MKRKDLEAEVSSERIERAAAQAILREEARRVTVRKQIRKARREASERAAERRARAHRLITLGAEVEASGLADLLGHDTDALFGVLAAMVDTAGKQEGDLGVRKFAEFGRERRAKVESPESNREGEAATGRKAGRTLPGGRVMIRFSSPPPEGVRCLLRALDYRWRLGLRSWVGDTPLDNRATELVRGFGGEILPGPDATAPSES